jgi:hypothetical protein
VDVVEEDDALGLAVASTSLATVLPPTATQARGEKHASAVRGSGV